MEAMPIPNPPTIRYTLNQKKLSTTPVPNAETTNKKEATISIFFRPYRSLHEPDNNAPIKQPTNALLMAHPRKAAESPKRKKGS